MPRFESILETAIFLFWATRSQKNEIYSSLTVFAKALVRNSVNVTYKWRIQWQSTRRLRSCKVNLTEYENFNPKNCPKQEFSVLIRTDLRDDLTSFPLTWLHPHHDRSSFKFTDSPDYGVVETRLFDLKIS